MTRCTISMCLVLLLLAACQQAPVAGRIGEHPGSPAAGNDVPGGFVRDPAFSNAPPLGIRPGADYAEDR
jgi:hypothetical protein